MFTYVLYKFYIYVLVNICIVPKPDYTSKFELNESELGQLKQGLNSENSIQRGNESSKEVI